MYLNRYQYSIIVFLSIPILLNGAISQEYSNKLSKEERNQIITKAGDLLINNYVSADLGVKCAEYLKKQLQTGVYDRITHPREFVKKLNSDLIKIHEDKHVRVQYISSDQEKLQQQNPIVAKMLDISEKALDNYGLREVKVIDGNVGYVDIRSFEPVELAGSKVSSVMDILKDSDALIIDLRENRGGNPAMVQYICSYFFDQPILLNSFYWRRGDYVEEFWTLSNISGKKRPKVPIFILTSGSTFSAGEEFAYDLQALKRATIIGETTAGGANPGITFRINQRFSIFLPTGRAINPITGTNWEGFGVEPDIRIEAEGAVAVAIDKARQAANIFRANKNEAKVDYFIELSEKLNDAEKMFTNGNIDSADSLVLKEIIKGLDLDFINEYGINMLAYNYLYKDKINVSFILLKININQFPKSFNAYDSLAEAYLKIGDTENAIKNCRISLQLNPQNQNAKMNLGKLGIKLP